MLSCLSRVQLFVTPWTAACQAPLSVGFSRQEYWSGQPFPSPGDLPGPGFEPLFLMSPALVGGFFTIEPLGRPLFIYSHAHSVIKTTSSGRERSSVAASAKSLQSCPTLCDPIDGSPPGCPVPGILQAGVGCHFLLQCMKVKTESEVAQSCPTLCNPMDCSLPGSSTHGIFQARVLEWGAIAFSGSSVTIPILCRCQLGLVGGGLPKLPTTS